jgi:hypothetical protein
MRHRQFIPENFAAASVAISQRLVEQRGEELHGVTAEQRDAVVAAMFDEMHVWATNHLPMGAPAKVSEEFIRKGMKAAREKLQHHPPAGIEPMTVLTVISALFSIVGWILKWWRGEA